MQRQEVDAGLGQALERRVGIQQLVTDPPAAVEIDLDSADAGAATALLEELADKLLANTVIEEYKVELVEG